MYALNLYMILKSKIILIYLILELGAPPLFILCVKQTILSPHTQRPPSF